MLPVWPVELASRRPLFNQMIVNSYSPGQGIRAHVDLASFADGIVSVSLHSPVVMDFRCCATDELTEVRKAPDASAQSGSPQRAPASLPLRGQ